MGSFENCVWDEGGFDDFKKYAQAQRKKLGNDLKSELIGILQDYSETRGTCPDMYKNTFFGINGKGKSKAEKLDAVSKLLDLLEGKDNTQRITEEELETLRNGDLGREIRIFVKENNVANMLDIERPVKTVSGLIQALNETVKSPQLDFGC